MRVRQLEVKLEPGKCQSPIQAGVGIERNSRAMAGGLEDEGLACPSRPPDSRQMVQGAVTVLPKETKEDGRTGEA